MLTWFLCWQLCEFFLNLLKYLVDMYKRRECVVQRLFGDWKQTYDPAVLSAPLPFVVMQEEGWTLALSMSLFENVCPQSNIYPKLFKKQLFGILCDL